MNDDSSKPKPNPAPGQEPSRKHDSIGKRSPIKASNIKTTLPMGSIPPVMKRRKLKENDLISSASALSSYRMKAVSGTVTLDSERLPENLARELINRRFAQYDYHLVDDYQFTHQDVAVTLDGYDPKRHVGYQYISHADQDVVTDHDVATTKMFTQLETAGEARILVIHDGEVVTGDALIELVDDFLAMTSKPISR